MTQLQTTSNPAAIIAKNCARIRRYRGMKQTELAAAMTEYGVLTTREVIANIETNRRQDIGVNEWYAIAASLGVPPDLLLQDELLI